MSNGRYINPSRLRMVGAEKLNKEQMAEFELQKEAIRARMQQNAGTTLARAGS
jgi:hypothetical protein